MSPRPGNRLAAARQFCLVVWAGGTSLASLAQPALPPEAVSQFNATIGYRLEAVTVLGGDHSAAGGFYTFRGGDVADLALSKFGGSGRVAKKAPLGNTGLAWAPVLVGNLGLLDAKNSFESGYLVGNETQYDILAVQAGGGGELFFTEQFSSVLTLSGIYAHTENEFLPRNAVGDFVAGTAQGTFVNWDIDTWSVVPAADLRYALPWHRASFLFVTRYTFFHTESFQSSSPVLDIEGESSTWENRVEVDIPTGWRVANREFHLGGFLARTELYGGVAEGLNADYTYSANGRLVLNVLEDLWVVRWIGVGATYFWGDDFAGWSAGLDLSLAF
jgi:hypothetical protein